MTKLGLLLSIFLATGAMTAHAESVYKWTDENGVTHFGDRQPTGKKSESVNVRSGTSHSNGSEKSSPQDKVRAMDKAREEQQASTQEARKEEAEAKQRQKNCEMARDNLKTISSHARIKITENGEQRYLSPEEIEQKKNEFQEVVERDCQQ